MTTYTITAPDNYPRPRISGSVGTDLQFKFCLDPSWKQLYDRDTNESHKITGVSELLNRNSMRLAVRRHPFATMRGLVAVFYLHRNSKTTYDSLKDDSGRAILLDYEQYYYCRIWQNGLFWQLDLFTHDMKLLSSASAQMNIGSFPIGRRLSSVYIEPSVFSEPIITYIDWIKR